MEENKPVLSELESRPRKTRRGLARLDSNIQKTKEDLASLPAADIYAKQIENISRLKKQCNIKARKEAELLFHAEVVKQEELNRQKQSNEAKPSSPDEIEDEDLAIFSSRPPPAPLDPEVHRLLLDLEMTKAAFEREKLVQVVDDEEPDMCEVERAVMVVRVFCRGRCHRMNVSMDEPFLTIINEIAHLLKVKPAHFSLFYQDIMIKSTDTPRSINLDVAHTIEAFIMDEPNVNFTKSPVATKQPNKLGEKLNLKIQTQDTKMKINIQIDKNDQMSVLMEKFAQMTDFSIERLVFHFDGEEILPTDTPEDLGLEDGYCIDVIVKCVKF